MSHRDARFIPGVGLSRPEQLDSAVTAVSTGFLADALAGLDRAHRPSA